MVNIQGPVNSKLAGFSRGASLYTIAERRYREALSAIDKPDGSEPQDTVTIGRTNNNGSNAFATVDRAVTNSAKSILKQADDLVMGTEAAHRSQSSRPNTQHSTNSRTLNIASTFHNLRRSSASLDAGMNQGKLNATEIVKDVNGIQESFLLASSYLQAVVKALQSMLNTPL